MNNQEWIDDVVGKPYLERTDGPDTFDCFGLVMDYVRRVLGRECSLTGFDTGTAFADLLASTDDWVPSEQGFAMCCFIDEAPTHCGVVIGDRVIHAMGHNYTGQVHNHSMLKFKRMFSDARLYDYVG